MAIFVYTIKDVKGNISSGKLEAESQEKAISYLHKQGFSVLSINLQKERSKPIRKIKVKAEDLVIFSRQLTTLIESSIPIVGALEILSQQTQNLYFKEVIKLILKDLKEGSSLAKAFSKYPDIFSELYISMVEAAETSGNLAEILERVALYLEKTYTLKKKIKSSLTYPIAVILMAIGITAFLLIKVVPTFKNIFAMLGGKLPLPTLILIQFSELLRKYFFGGIFFLFFLSFLFKKYISTEKGKKVYHRSLLKLPIFGDLIKKMSIAKFSRTFSTLVRSGVPIVNALEIVGKTSGNKIIEEAVNKAKKCVQEGTSISKPLEESGIFPPMVVKMIAIGEQSGKLEEMLSKIAQFYEEQTEIVISSLTSLIEPLVIGFLGIVVGGIVVSLFLPIIQITRLIGR